MATTTVQRSPSVRSFADLGAMLGLPQRPAFGRPRNSRQRRKDRYDAQRPTRDPAEGFGPFVPCAMCGLNFRYSLAVSRVIGEGFAGFTHPLGTCDPAAVTAWQAKVALQGEVNATMDEVRLMKAGQARKEGTL